MLNLCMHCPLFTNKPTTQMEARSPRNRLGEASFPSRSRGGVLGNGLCWRPSKNSKCSCRCDFTSQIASQINPQHLKPKFLLRSMPPEPLDNASNSFPSKLKILASSVKTWGDRLHTTDLPLATFLEKRRHSIFEDEHPGCTITYSLDEIIVWVCIYELSRKVVVVIALSKVWLNSSLNLVSSCKMYSVISPSRCMDHSFLSLVPRLSQHKASPIHGPVHSPGFVVTLYFSAFSNSSTPILVGKCLVDDSSCGSSTCNPCCQRNIF